MTVAQLESNAMAKGARVERNHEEFIGICFKGQNTYHWFRIWSDDQEVYFDHSYSCITGRISRGVMHGLRVKESLGFYKNQTSDVK